MENSRRVNMMKKYVMTNNQINAIYRPFCIYRTQRICRYICLRDRLVYNSQLILQCILQTNIEFIWISCYVTLENVGELNSKHASVLRLEYFIGICFKKTIGNNSVEEVKKNSSYFVRRRFKPFDRYFQRRGNSFDFLRTVNKFNKALIIHFPDG